MKKILIIGAGRSSTHLVEYLAKNATKQNWEITLADRDLSLAQERIKNLLQTKAVALDISNVDELEKNIQENTIVVSMLPARFHVQVAEICVRENKSLFTASYVSDELKKLDQKAKEKNILLMNELGLDPGIDHISALHIMEKLKHEGKKLLGFESFTGGLIAPESDNNPWNYKFTWNPRNVVLAGQGGVAKFIEQNEYKYIPYHRLFIRTETIEIPGYGLFEGYANRDSLKYRELYNLVNIPTIYRGTLRRKGFCKSWNTFVQLGMTDDSYILEGSKEMTHRSFTNSFLFYRPNDSVELKLQYYLDFDFDSDEMAKLEWLGLFSDEKIGMEKDATPAQILQKILEKKWTLEPEDKDMIVMWHKFVYLENGNEKQMNSYMICKGENTEKTAMSKTVGLPLAIGIKKYLTGELNFSGVHIPNHPEIYNPILKELESNGIVFNEEVVN